MRPPFRHLLGGVAGVLMELGLVGCGFAPRVVPDGMVDAEIDAPVVPLPSSCNAIHTASPGQTSGMYMIDPDGAGGDTPLSVQCDMDSDGGGWTIIFTAAANVSSVPVTYTTATTRLLADAQKVQLAYRGSTFGASTQRAVFDLPNSWRTDAPFNYSMSDVTTGVSIDGASPVNTTVRFGYQSFSSTCADPWITNAGMYGRICVVGTTAPFFTGFATPLADDCSDSSSIWNAASCSTSVRFSIAVR